MPTIALPRKSVWMYVTVDGFNVSVTGADVVDSPELSVATAVRL